MLWQGENDIGFRETMLRCITLLNLVSQRPNIATLARVMPQVFDGTEIVITAAETASTGPWFVIIDPNRQTCIAVAGGFVIGSMDPLLLAQGWSGRGTDIGRFTAPYARTASDIAFQLAKPFFEAYTQVTLIGHSFGGSVITQIAGDMPLWQAGSQVPMRVYTFGAPKPWPGSRSMSLAGVIYRRLFADNDPVPTFPPPVQLAQPVTDLLNYVQALYWNQWIQWGAGLQMNQGGTTTTAANPSVITTLNRPFLIAAWLTGDEVFGSVTHSLRAYANLIDAVAPFDPVQPDTPPLRVRTPPMPITPTELRVIQDVSAGVSSSIVQNNAQVAADNIRIAFPPRPGVKFRGRRFRGKRAIFYGADLVTYVHSRRAQISLVRYLNKQIRRGSSGISLVQSLAP